MSGAVTKADPGRFITNGAGQYGWSEDSLEVLYRGEVFDFEIEEPWSGSTESGFGARCDLSLSRDQAESLAKWILAELANTPSGVTHL